MLRRVAWDAHRKAEGRRCGRRRRRPVRVPLRQPHAQAHAECDAKHRCAAQQRDEQWLVLPATAEAARAVLLLLREQLGSRLVTHCCAGALRCQPLRGRRGAARSSAHLRCVRAGRSDALQRRRNWPAAAPPPPGARAAPRRAGTDSPSAASGGRARAEVRREPAALLPDAVSGRFGQNRQMTWRQFEQLICARLTAAST